MNKILSGIARDLKSVPESLKARLGDMDAKKLLLMGIPYIIAGYVCDKAAWLWRVSADGSASDKMAAFFNRMDRMFVNPFPSLHPKDLLFGICCGIALRLAVYWKAKNAKKFRQGVEYGSARWGT